MDSLDEAREAREDVKELKEAPERPPGSESVVSLHGWMEKNGENRGETWLDGIFLLSWEVGRPWLELQRC